MPKNLIAPLSGAGSLAGNGSEAAALAGDVLAAPVMEI
jgi:hypothetical protein